MSKRKLDEASPASNQDSQTPPSLQCLLRWLDSHGCKRDGITFRQDAHGGIGAFAARKYTEGELLATLPRECVLTAKEAVESPIGIAAQKAAVALKAEQYCTPDSLLWVCMCVGRVDTAHRWYPYLASLPTDSPDPACWPASHRALLDSTPIAASITEARAQIESCYEHWVSKLGELSPDLFPKGSISIDMLLWARGMFTSRAAPAELGAGADESVVGAGVMLPLFDLLNHKVGQPITWLTNQQGVHFQTDAAIEQGCEVYNNYGAKPNEELLFLYGFAVRENSCDAVSVCMVAGGQRERYYIERQEAGGIPAELWQALSAASQGDGGDDGEADGSIEVGFEELELLMTTLQRKAVALEAHAIQDRQTIQESEKGDCGADVESRRRYFVAVYRQGQREVLEETMSTLQSMLGEGESEEIDGENKPL